MTNPKKNPPDKGRLGDFVCVSKQRLAKELSDFRNNVKSKEEVEAVADVFFESMRRLNLGRR